MLKQSLERLITLGQRQCGLACGGADLGGGFHIQALEHLGKLIVAHQRLAYLCLCFLVTKDVLDRKVLLTHRLQCADQMGFLLRYRVDKVRFQCLSVKFEYRVNKHTQRQINQLEFSFGEPCAYHHLKDVVR